LQIGNQTKPGDEGFAILVDGITGAEHLGDGCGLEDAARLVLLASCNDEPSVGRLAELLR
jgi:hypothetical protein